MSENYFTTLIYGVEVNASQRTLTYDEVRRVHPGLGLAKITLSGKPRTLLTTMAVTCCLGEMAKADLTVKHWWDAALANVARAMDLEADPEPSWLILPHRGFTD